MWLSAKDFDGNDACFHNTAGTVRNSLGREITMDQLYGTVRRLLPTFDHRTRPSAEC
jgi:hypothetical protein